ncbi:hypothetical protein BGZ83_002935 [Gryganskiella cystojenkinii]|nr:hypothetical protein BGZ83_002935 [Gryganskiella cystojenkinii]
MSSGKSKRSSGKNSNNQRSPSGSPPMPPAPNQSRNRETAAPHHFDTMLASQGSSTAATSPSVTGSSTSVNSLPGSTESSTRSRSSKGKGAAITGTTKGELNSHHVTAPPGLTNGSTVAQAGVPSIRGSHRRKKKNNVFRRLIARLLLVYLGYTLIFVCPDLKDTKSDAVCHGVVRLQDWLRPYSEPVVARVDETYRTYAEPYVEQYGVPIYKQSEKIYFETVQPAIKTASKQAQVSYDQYARPHVNKAYERIYTDDVKAHVNRAQTTFNVYQTQAQEHFDHAQALYKDAQDQYWKIHKTHVQPVVDKVSPHAKVAWEKASIGAKNVYDTASVMYMQHVNPYAQQSLEIVFEAAGNAKESFLHQTDEIWGTSFSKSKKPKTAGERLYDSAAEKVHFAKEKAQAASAAAAKMAHDAAKRAHLAREPEPTGVKDKILKKASAAQKAVEDYAEEAKEAIAESVKGAQRVAGEYSETIKAAAAGMAAGGIKHAADSVHHNKVVTDTQEAKKAAVKKGQGAQAMVEQVIENVAETIAKTVHDAQKAVVDEAEQIKHYADEKVKEAGKITDEIKHQVIEKAHEAQEAVRRQAENVQGAGTKMKGSIIGSTHDTDEKLAKQEAAEDLSRKAQKMYDAAERQADGVKGKVVKAGHDAKHGAKDSYEGAKKVVQDQVKHAQEVFEDQTEHVRKPGERMIKDGKKMVNDQTENAQEFAAQQVKIAHDQVEKAKGQAAKKVKEAGEQVQHAREQAAQKFRDATDQAEDVKDYTDKRVKDAQNYASHKTGEASEQIEHVKETVKHKAHDAHTASKASLAAMLKGIETTFGQFYTYEEAETENLWNKLQSAIDEHLAGAKKSAQDLEHASRDAYESFEAYVKDWSKEASGDTEGHISSLSQKSMDSIKSISQKTEHDRRAAKSKVDILTNNVEVYLSGLKSFLSDRLAATKETVVSELSVFRDESSADDDKTASAKLAQLDAAARARLESAGGDARTKAHQLLKQVDDVWLQSEVKSQEYVERMRELAKKASEDAQASLKKAKTGSEQKIASTKDETIKEKVHSTAEHVRDAVHDAAAKAFPSNNQPGQDQQQKAFVIRDSDPGIPIAMEEPGSGHRHHRH